MVRQKLTNAHRVQQIDEKQNEWKIFEKAFKCY